MVDWTTVRRDGPEYVDDFGTLLLDRLGMLGLNTVDYYPVVVSRLVNILT